MRTYSIDSSNIGAASYDLGTRRLRLFFVKAVDGGRLVTSAYDYEHVEPAAMASLLFAPSVGEEFSKTFRALYKGVKLEGFALDLALADVRKLVASAGERGPLITEAVEAVGE